MGTADAEALWTAATPTGGGPAAPFEITNVSRNKATGDHTLYGDSSAEVHAADKFSHRARKVR